MHTLGDAIFCALHLPVAIDIDLSGCRPEQLVDLSYRFFGSAPDIAAGLRNLAAISPERRWGCNKLAAICIARGPQGEHDTAAANAKLAQQPLDEDDFGPPRKEPTSIIEAVSNVVKLSIAGIELDLDQRTWDRVCRLYPETAEVTAHMLTKLAANEPDPVRRAALEERADRCVQFGVLGYLDHLDDDEPLTPVTHDIWRVLNNAPPQ